jgi:hypothetical protein
LQSLSCLVSDNPTVLLLHPIIALDTLHDSRFRLHRREEYFPPVFQWLSVQVVKEVYSKKRWGEYLRCDIIFHLTND